jgi:hypothetical protein
MITYLTRYVNLIFDTKTVNKNAVLKCKVIKEKYSYFQHVSRLDTKQI